MRNGLPVIGLLGGIGAGKSTVASILHELGCVVADADVNAKAALHDPAILAQLVSMWGSQILKEDGSANKAEIAKFVFSDPAKRHELEKLSHPFAHAVQEKQFDEAPDGTIALVIDAPLLLEVGIEDQCDILVFVDAPREIRLDRVSKNRGWDEEELNRREAVQLPLDNKRKRADYVIINVGIRDEVKNQIKSVLVDIQARQFKKS